MEVNALEMIINIAKRHDTDLSAYKPSSDVRVVRAGEGLEGYIKDALAGSFGASIEERLLRYKEAFSWQGNQANPPDLTAWEKAGGDAFEIKKMKTAMADIELNSSYPRDYLYAEDKMISKGCKAAEEWSKKDMFYVVGYAPSSKIKCLTIIHGPCYAADRETYERPRRLVREGLESGLHGIDLARTRELGRINGVDPLRITDLRVRGMWMIRNPLVLFREFFDYNKAAKGKEFSLFAIISAAKYAKFSAAARSKAEGLKGIEVKDIRVTDPNNISSSISAKLILGGW
ncbi:MAG: NgoPII family restriction endonuclease [Candidatus Micrarchaeia archaeon]